MSDIPVVYSVTPPFPYFYLGKVVSSNAPIVKKGAGYLSSSFPEYIVSVEGVPTEGEVRVLLRSASFAGIDGTVVAITKSSVSGQWYVGGLNPNLRYDVVCRFDGYNDLIFSDITPLV